MSYTVTLGIRSIAITPNSPSVHPVQYVSKRNVISVVPLTFQQKSQYVSPERDQWRYRYDTMTCITFSMKGGERFTLELQDVTNQPTWSDGTLNGLNLAMRDITSWMVDIFLLNDDDDPILQEGTTDNILIR